MGRGLCEGGSEESVARVLARCHPGGGVAGWAEEARPAGESPAANGRAVHARKAKRRPRRLGERERRSNCAWGIEASHAQIGEKRYGADLARVP